MRRLAVAGLLVSLFGALGACVSMPESGPVVDTQATARLEDQRATAIDPLPPQQGASVVQIAQGFLEAMTQTPISTSVNISVAREYLAEDARATWDPDASTIIYEESSPPVASGADAHVQLSGAERLDARGAWVGDLEGSTSTLGLRMVLEDGEYRIIDPPDALIVPALWFEQRFREVSLYYFDRTGQILVPESVFVPRGQQLASSLTEGLLDGPAGDARRVVRTFIPSGLDVGLSVPISDGVAEVSLLGETPERSADASTLMLAQLAATLQQDPSVTSIRVTIGGQPVTPPGGSTDVPVDGDSQYSATGYQASTLLFGLDAAGRMVAGPAEELDPVSGPWGREDVGARSIAIDLGGQVAAAVSADGTAVLRGPVRDDGTPQRIEQILSGASDLLDPAWDFADRMWLVDRTPDGARVSYVVGDRTRTVDVPGISGRDVVGFLVSRDATRLVAVVRVPGGDEVRTARILVSDQGRVRRAVPGTTIESDDGGELRVRDLAWASPTSVSLLSRVSPGLSEVRTVTIDGAPRGLSSLSTTVAGPVASLAGSPLEGEATYALTRGSLVDVGTGSALPDDVALRALVYVG